jgi:hypothetical protein
MQLCAQRRTVTFFFGEAKIRQNYFVRLFLLTEMQTSQLIVRPVNGKKDWGAFAYFAYMYGTPLYVHFLKLSLKIWKIGVKIINSNECLKKPGSKIFFFKDFF